MKIKHIISTLLISTVIVTSSIPTIAAPNNIEIPANILYYSTENCFNNASGYYTDGFGKDMYFAYSDSFETGSMIIKENDYISFEMSLSKVADNIYYGIVDNTDYFLAISMDCMRPNATLYQNDQYLFNFIIEKMTSDLDDSDFSGYSNFSGSWSDGSGDYGIGIYTSFDEGLVVGTILGPLYEGKLLATESDNHLILETSDHFTYDLYLDESGSYIDFIALNRILNTLFLVERYIP